MITITEYEIQCGMYFTPRKNSAPKPEYEPDEDTEVEVDILIRAQFQERQP